MAITKDKKVSLVEEYTENLGESRALFLAHYSGLTVGQVERVRDAMYEEQTHLEVLRNRLFLLAANKTGQGAVSEVLDGPTLAVFCKGDPTSPAKTLATLNRELEALDVYGGLLGTAVLNADQFKELASLPSREELLAKLMGSLQSPVYGLVGVLGGVLRSLLYVLQARVEQLEGPASAEEAA